MNYTATDHTFAVCAYGESRFLEDCIKSLLVQHTKSTVILATATPNDRIRGMAEKYRLPLFVNTDKPSISGDWNFALSCAETPLVTLAHQDDVYEPEYLDAVLNALNRAKNPIICFSHYAELRNGQKTFDNTLLRVKKLMLLPLKPHFAWTSRFLRRRVLSLGNPICCPAVTYVLPQVGQNPFRSDFKCDLDWQQWELLSRKKGAFVYLPQPLMCHRIHQESTTSEIIGENLRTQEDFAMYRRFWPEWMAKQLIKRYAKSQQSNNL